MTGILIRPARVEDCPAMGRVLVEATRDAFRDRVPHACLNWLTPEESAANWAKNFNSSGMPEDRDRIFVAQEDGGGVVGLAMLSEITPTEYDLDFTAPYTHELRSLQVHPSRQRGGVGRGLVTYAAQEMRMDGKSRLLVRVLQENPKFAFYEHLGADRLGIRPYEWEGYQTHEIFLGWKDVRVLCHE